MDDCPPPPLPAADPPPFLPPVQEEEENDTASVLGFVYADSQASTAAAVRPPLRQQRMARPPPPMAPVVRVVPLVWAPGIGGAVRMTVAAGEISRQACEQASAIFDSLDTLWSENSNVPDSLVPQLEAIEQQMRDLQMQLIMLHRTLGG